MNSLIDIFDLTPQEIMELINMACDIIDRPAPMRTSATGKYWLRYSLNRPHAPA